MTKIEISNSQLQDAGELFSEAASDYGGLSQAEVPRPSFADFRVWSAMQNITHHQKLGGFVVGPGMTLERFARLMGVAVVPRRGSRPETFPAIVLDDGQRLGVLGGQETAAPSPLKQALLDNIYLNHRAGVLSHPLDRSAAGVGGHAVIAASALASGADPHETVHSFEPKTFGSEAAKKAVFDIKVGHSTLAVRSAVFDLARVAFIASEAYQPATGDALGSGLTGEEANVAFVLAATLSDTDKRRSFDLQRNLAAMDGNI